MNDSTRYHLLRILERDPRISQRALARELGLSLGKTNYCLRALMEKGWIKASNFRNSHNKAAYMYILTPRGLSAKARITKHFLERKLREFEQLEKEIEQLREEVGS